MFFLKSPPGVATEDVSLFLSKLAKNARILFMFFFSRNKCLLSKKNISITKNNNPSELILFFRLL